jgi:methionyl-tRNA formyltransferase
VDSASDFHGSDKADHMKKQEKSLQFQKIDAVFIAGHLGNYSGLCERLRERNIEPHLFTSPSQVDLFGDVLPKDLYVTESLDSKFFAWFHERAQSPNFLVLSFGARWIFSEEIITGLFESKIVNFHGTRLPIDRGGGGFSWRIMRGDRIGSLLVHLVEPGIDTGSILRQRSYVFPSTCHKPIDYITHYRKLLDEFVVGLVDDLSNGVVFELSAQPQHLSHYLPRLDSTVNSAIDWSWDGADICRFILAFDDPYPGAITTVQGRPVHIKDALLHRGEVPSHPFEKGLVIRHEGDWIVVAAGDQNSLIFETVLGVDGSDCLAEIKVGDRFHTPADMLDKSLETRARFGPA